MKTICIYHSVDLDGWMSAAIVEHWFLSNLKDNDSYDLIKDNKKYEQQRGRGEYKSLTFLGWNYGDSIPDLSEYDKVIMCDISFPKEEMTNIANNKEFVWIDHHISAIKDNSNLVDLAQCEGAKINLRLNPKFAACELTWKYFFPDETMPEIVRLLGRYDCFGHKGTDEEEHVLIFQYAARATITNYEEAYHYLTRWDGNNLIPSMMLSGDAIYSYLCTEAEQTYKKGFEITLYESVEVLSSLQSRPRNFLCVNKERFNPVNFGIDYHKDGYDGVACFWFENGQWTFSLYNDNGEVDCSTIAKQYGGGGHKGAAGFRIDDLYKILDENN